MALVKKVIIIIPSLITTPASPKPPIIEGKLRFKESTLCPMSTPRIEKGITDISIKVFLKELNKYSIDKKIRTKASALARSISFFSSSFFSSSPLKVSLIPSFLASSNKGCIFSISSLAVIISLFTLAYKKKLTTPSSFNKLSKDFIFTKVVTSLSLTYFESSISIIRFCKPSFSSLFND